MKEKKGGFLRWPWNAAVYIALLAVFRLFDAVYQGEYAIASLIATCIIAIVLAVEALAYLITMKAGSRHVS